MLKKKAFTLIELLVVISIIAVLMSVMIPALGKAREMAKVTVCNANLKQIGTALTMYANSYGYKIMKVCSSNADPKKVIYCLDLIAPFLGEDNFKANTSADAKTTMAVMLCPSANKLANDGATGTYKNCYYHSIGQGSGYGSYGFNSWLTIDSAYAPADSLKKTFSSYSEAKSDVPFAADALWLNGWPTDKDVAPSSKLFESVSAAFNYSNLPYGSQHIWRFVTKRHNATSNVVFADSHVEKVKAESMWSLNWHRNFNKDNNVTVPGGRPHQD